MNAFPDQQPEPSAQSTTSGSELVRLQQLGNWYEKALRFSNIGLYRWESASDKWFWSDKVFEIRGFPKDEHYVSPEAFYARVHPDDRARLLAAEIACKNGDAPLNAEYRFVLPSGEERWHRELADRVVYGDGSGEALFGALMDITDQKRAELALAEQQEYLESVVAERTMALRIAKEAAESAHRAKNMFIANVSHELRTPLNGIMGMTDIAMRKSDDPKVKDCLGKARISSQRLLSLINDLIDIADIEAERVVLEHQPFLLADICKEVVQIIQPAASRKGLEFRIDITPALAARPLVGDAPRLTQVVLNLADNAVKFSTQGRIDIRFCVERETDSVLMLRCDVQDTGIGISTADQARLFTLFEQGDSSSTRRYGGTGLGLALSRKLVHLMNGEIVVHSQPGAGSTFRFTSQQTVA
ncbi:MAG: PAS domain-containing protein [Proteobacteria bacterium]|nr:PAS domain-containing protein [Pseudomonadota bacterium]